MDRRQWLLAERPGLNGPLMAFFIAGLCVATLTGAIRWLALRSSMLDHPNPRSAHMEPLPLGGGAAIAIVVCMWLAVAPLDGLNGIVLALAGAAIAAIGFVDDLRSVSKWLRLLVHGMAIAVLLRATEQMGHLDIPGLPRQDLLEASVALISLMWLVNLYNFMDGIDGLAAAEAVTTSLGMAACLHFGGYFAPESFALCLVTAGSALGFLVWNWPPARIFMGDVGSGFLGFVMGALAILAHRQAGLSLWVPVILLSVFVTDASLTLLRRMARRERWYEPHRLHAYQRLSRRFGAHRPVTVIAIAVNLFWLMPLAIAAARRPEIAGLLAGVAYTPVITCALLAGSGRPEADT
jgi:Fuc2NAc and GlcNAc transferase